MRILLPALIGSIALTACAADDGAPEPDEKVADAADELRRYDVHRLLDDEDLRGGQAVTEAQVQAFLTREGSYLARYADRSGRSAARIVVDESRAHRVNPVYMLARIQVESSLVESGASRGLSTATGCACPDGRSCSAREAGFANQVACAAEYVEDYYAELARDGETRAGWAVGRTKRTLDPCSVTPSNKATAVLYTYTPWVGGGGRQCGQRGIGGSSLVASIYAKYAPSFGQ
jgi:hypothetical protein